MRPKIMYLTVSAFLSSIGLNGNLYFKHKVFDLKVRTQQIIHS